jgi:hypothetical protein
MYWQYTTAFAVSVAAAMNPIVRKANDATAILVRFWPKADIPFVLALAGLIQEAPAAKSEIQKHSITPRRVRLTHG